TRPASACRQAAHRARVEPRPQHPHVPEAGRRRDPAMTERTALYPGSFDPVTLGHLDILERAASIFDRVVIAVLVNPAKEPLFTADERVTLLRKAMGDAARVTVATFEGLTVDYAKSVGAIA